MRMEVDVLFVILRSSERLAYKNGVWVVASILGT